MALAGSLDLFSLLVDNVTGSIFLSLIVWAGIMLVAGIIGRMSMKSILIIILTYASAALVGYVGALAAVPLFLFALWYMVSGIINWINGMR